MEKDSQKRHAFCIMAHDDTYCLKTLISLLDHPNNDIFLLIDKKSHKIREDILQTHASRLTIIPPNKRIDIRWGGLSIVEGELLLFKEALDAGEYAYLHLLSGADLPIKSMKYIHQTFETLPMGTNVITFSHGEKIEENLNFKTKYYHPFVENQRFRKDGNPLHLATDLFAKSFRKTAVSLQRLIRFKRKWDGLTLKKGSQWISITSEFARYLVDRKNFILKKFQGVICADEIFVQTLIYNSPFRDTIYDYERIKPCFWKIDWTRGNPYVWRDEDFTELMESESLFARKFSSFTDSEIIKKIEKAIQPEK